MKLSLAALPFDVRPGEVAHNLKTALAGLEEAADVNLDLLLLPEKWTTSFLPKFSNDICQQSDDALNQMHERALELGVTVVGSAPGRAVSNTQPLTSQDLSQIVKPYNQLHFLGVGGRQLPYRKRALFSPTGEGRQCQAGECAPPTIALPKARVSGVICYDLRFPELTRESFWDAADLLLVCAQWPTPRMEILELLARARAAENQMWVLVCNRSGSAPLGDKRVLDFPGNALLINPLGEIVEQCSQQSTPPFLFGEADLDLSAQIRQQVPCHRDAVRANLKP